MKILVYFSGITGVLLIVLGLLGIFLEFPRNNLIFLSGIIFLGLFFLPGFLFVIYHQEKMPDKVIKSNIVERKIPKTSEEKDPKPKGWGMNNSPYRDRKSGLTWGGGNIKGANATRGNRKSFLR